MFFFVIFAIDKDHVTTYTYSLNIGIGPAASAGVQATTYKTHLVITLSIASLLLIYFIFQSSSSFLSTWL